MPKKALQAKKALHAFDASWNQQTTAITAAIGKFKLKIHITKVITTPTEKSVAVKKFWKR
jgi:hypothetical protein